MWRSFAAEYIELAHAECVKCEGAQRSGVTTIQWPRIGTYSQTCMRCSTMLAIESRTIVREGVSTVLVILHSFTNQTVHHERICRQARTFRLGQGYKASILFQLFHTLTTIAVHVCSHFAAPLRPHFSVSPCWQRPVVAGTASADTRLSAELPRSRSRLGCHLRDWGGHRQLGG